MNGSSAAGHHACARRNASAVRRLLLWKRRHKVSYIRAGLCVPLFAEFGSSGGGGALTLHCCMRKHSTHRCMMFAAHAKANPPASGRRVQQGTWACVDAPGGRTPGLEAAAAAARAGMYARSPHLAKTFEGEAGMAPRMLHREAANKPQLNLLTSDIGGAQVRTRVAGVRARVLTPVAACWSCGARALNSPRPAHATLAAARRQRLVGPTVAARRRARPRPLPQPKAKHVAERPRGTDPLEPHYKLASWCVNGSTHTQGIDLAQVARGSWQNL